MRAEIISVGTELLLGDIVNTNAQFLAQELASLGFTVYYQSVVGDNPIRLRSLIQMAKDRSDLLVFTGGLGPTDDDLTKETVAEMYGDTLVLDPDALAEIEHFFAQRGYEMTDNNRKQALVPQRGRKLANPNGTAPGAFFRQGNKYAVLLPGPPGEMRPMFENEVRPLLEDMQEGSIRSLTLRVFGMGESELENRVYNLLGNANPTAALYAKTGEVHIRITARASSAQQAEVMCGEYALLFRQILGDLVYSECGENLEETVVKRLVERGESLATAESCTGGLLSERITSVPGASAVFGFGATTYANEVKRELLRVRGATLRRHGAVSSQVAAEMAFGAATRGVATYGVGITGIAGPGGGTPEKPVGLVYVAVSQGRKVYVKRLNLAGRDRDHVRWMATQHALDMVRRLVEGLPIADAKEFDRTQYADYERIGKPKRRGGGLWRGLVALLVVAGIFIAVMLGLYFTQQNAPLARSDAPSAQGLRYGTPEYTAAACALVAREAELNPAVAGFLAMPGGGMEQLVGRSPQTKEGLQSPDGQAGLSGMAALPAGASIGKGGANTLVLGAKGLAGLQAFLDTGKAGELSTFTYYTARDAREYQIYALLVVDENEERRDGYNPAIAAFGGMEDYLTFTLGSRMRSLYDIPASLSETDSYMTVAAIDTKQPARRVVVCGRLLRSEEKEVMPAAAVSGSVLMPTAWYGENGAAMPNLDELWDYQMRRYLVGNTGNAALQLAAGLPAQDKTPLIPAPRPPSPAVESGEVPGSAASAGSGAGSASSGSGPVSSSAGSSAASPSSAAAPVSSRTAGTGVGTPPTPGGGAQPLRMNLAAGANNAAGASASESGSSITTSSSTVPGSGSREESGPAAGSGEAASGQAASSGPASSSPPAPAREAPKRPDPGWLTVNMNGRVITAATTDVLAWICQSECGWMGAEAIKAHAVAAHSWILNQQGAGNAAPRVVGAMPSQAVREAVAPVAQQVVTADGENPACAAFFPMAAQATNTAADLWGGSRSYLASVPSIAEQSRDGWREIVALPRAKVAALLLERAGIDLSAYPEPNSWFRDLEKNSGGYVTSLKVGERTVNGSAFWRQMLAGEQGPLLRSPAFDISFDGEAFLFTVYGSGHGVGMSQAGAEAMAREGRDYAAILQHYYPGTEVVPWE